MIKNGAFKNTTDRNEEPRSAERHGRLRHLVGTMTKVTNQYIPHFVNT